MKSNFFSKVAKIQGKNLVCSWNILDEHSKRYAAYLVKRYACPVRLAIQQAYLVGYSTWFYDYRTKRLVRETTPKSAF